MTRHVDAGRLLKQQTIHGPVGARSVHGTSKLALAFDITGRTLKVSCHVTTSTVLSSLGWEQRNCMITREYKVRFDQVHE